MDKSELEYCQHEIKTRLRKYVALKTWGDAEVTKASEKMEEIMRQYAIEHRTEPPNQFMEKMRYVLNQLFPYGADSIDQFNMLSCNVDALHLEGDPEFVPDIIKYSQMVSDLNLLLTPCYWVYEKDICRAIAYYRWLENLKLKETDFRDNIIFDLEDYSNIPIDIRISLKNGGSTKLCLNNIGGGIFHKICVGVDGKYKGAFREIFRNSKPAFGQSGEYVGEKEKGIGYENFRKGVEHLTRENSSMKAEDIWFFKNVLNPDLIIAMQNAKGESSLRQSDFKLLWLLCGCKCPSVSVFAFEAIRPYYFYIRNLARKEERYLRFLFDKVVELVKKINKNFAEMMAWTEFLDQNIGEIQFVKSLNERYDKMFRHGDDIPFIFSDKFKINQCVDPWDGFENGDIYRSARGNVEDGKQEAIDDDNKRYYKYMYGLWEESESAKKSAGKIAYAVISALKEQQERLDYVNRQSQDEEIYENEITYKSRLYYHLRQKDIF